MSEPRIIVHADMDAFYAAVEQLDNPSLRGKPLLIGGDGARSVVCTASYEARKFGVGSAMPMVTAKRRCPDGIVVLPRFERYQEVSSQIREAFDRFSDTIEPLSLDEAFLDVSHTHQQFDGPHALGMAIKAAVKETTGGLTVSVGIANTKFVAKVASDFQKPDGLTIIAPEDALTFLHPLPVSRLWGAGPKTVARLEALGLHTIADVAAADRTLLGVALGRMGLHFYRLAHNDDPRPLVTHREPKSIGSERTLVDDIVGQIALEPHLLRAAEEIARRLVAKDVYARGLRVKLKTRDFQLITRQTTLSTPLRDPQGLYTHALALLPQFDLEIPIRLVGMAGYDLMRPGTPIQLPLFPL